MPTASTDASWRSTACNLCSINCGIEVEVEERRFKRVRGDRGHPSSRGYLCQKASRLDYYQNHAGRLTRPLRRAPDGTFEPIDWETAIREVARLPGCLSLPHGYGQVEGDRTLGPRINLLTSSDHCDPIAKTPYHKYVPVRLIPGAGAGSA